MRQIGVATLKGIEGHDETVGELFIEAFVALVGAVLNVKQAGDLADHTLQFDKAMVDLRGGDLWFELEYSEVSDHDDILFVVKR